MLVLSMSKINGYLPCPPPNTKTLESFQSIICPIFHVFVCGGDGRKDSLLYFRCRQLVWRTGRRGRSGERETSVQRPIHTLLSTPPHLTTPPTTDIQPGKNFYRKREGATFRNSTVISVLSLF